MLGLGSDKSTALSSEWTADVASDDLAQFTDATLKNYKLVFSCSPTGTVFSNNFKVTDKAAVMAAFQHFVENGGAWAGVHAATDFEKTGGFPWFTDTLVGAYLVSHENDGTPGTVQSDESHAASPVLTGLSPTYVTKDEWSFMSRDVTAQPGFQVLQRLAADNRPVTWIKEIANPGGGVGGRMFYTTRGHSKSVYQEKEFRELVRRGILWATRTTY
jgi:type 1 glutamine amidotransferase